jgi:hypothetical protein
MVMPEGLLLVGLIEYTLIVLVLMPFGGDWLLLVTNSRYRQPAVLVLPPTSPLYQFVMKQTRHI